MRFINTAYFIIIIINDSCCTTEMEEMLYGKTQISSLGAGYFGYHGTVVCTCHLPGLTVYLVCAWFYDSSSPFWYV